MRKIIFIAVLLSSLFILNTCDLFTPGFGNNVDLSPPLLFVTSHANGAFVRGTITISGNFEEDVATASIEVSFDNGLTYPQAATLNQSALTWSVGVDTTAIADGERDVLFRITDTAGKVTDKKIMLYFDNNPPLVVMSVPSVYDGSAEYYGTVALKGEAADQFGIAVSGIRIIIDNQNPPAAPYLVDQAAEGTNSWSYSFNSTAYNGTLYVTISATDRAGNVSAKYYHYSDIFAANGNNPIGIDDIYKYYTGTSTGAVRDYLLAEGDDPIPFNFNQEANKPIIEVYNPDPNIVPPAINLMSGNGRVSGKVIDENNVAVGSIEIYIAQTVSPFTVYPWTNSGLTETNAGTQSVGFTYQLPGLIDSDYVLQVRARDSLNNQRTTNSIAFSIDSGIPTIEVSQPAQGAYLPDDFTISGTATDAQGIKRVEVGVSTNGGLNYTYYTAAGTTSWSHLVDTGTFEGSMLLKILAVENTAEEKTGTFNMQVIIDRTNPTATFLNPSSSSTVNGLVLIRGTSSDNTQITNAEIRLGKDATWIPMSNLYNWEYQIDSTSYANATYADEEPPLPSDVWRIYIHARITDRAGNQYTKDDYYFLIDNDTDKPDVSILSPQAGATIGGSTVMSGTAIDDDGLYHVYMNLDLDNDGFYNHAYDLNGNSGTGSQIDTVAGLAIGDQANLFENEAYWYQLSGTTQWTVELNANGELYHINGQNGQITARVVAVDSKDGGVTWSIKGNNQVRSFRFDDTIPGFENMSHDSDSFVRGTFNLEGIAVDDVHVDKVEISYNGGVNWTTIYDPPTYDPVDNIPPAIDHYDFTGANAISINTETINGGVFNDSSGILYLRLKATDNTGYTKLQLIDLKVDNSYPTSTYTGSLSDIYGSTVNSFVQGTATDSGTVSGTKQVEVYFMRDNLIYNPTTGATTTLAQDTDLGDGSGFIYYPADTAYKIIIDNRYENGLSDLDGDGFKETFTVQGNNTLWSTQFNSLLIPDGAITIHYVTVDMSLNKHHYQTAAAPAGAFIKNYKPVVSSMTVGSDLNFSGAITASSPDEEFDYSLASYSSSNRFKARSRLLIRVDADDVGGINPGITNYEFFREGVSVQSGISDTLDINIVPPYPTGDTYYACVITDNDDITTTTDTFWINIDNVDATDPTIGIDEFDADGNPDNNIVDGHIELPANSKWDNGAPGPTDDDADISGIILLKGTAWDNFYVDRIELILDPSGATTVAQWSTSTDTLEPVGSLPNGGVFAIVSQTITPAGGHSVVWTYRWDTATVTGGAGKNKWPFFTVYDDESRDGIASKSYDVVPYISGIVNENGPPLQGLANDALRSSTGKYSIDYDVNTDTTNYFTIRGYNLNGTPRYINVTPAKITTPVTGADPHNISANVTGTPTHSEVRVRKEITRSGWLTVFINGEPTLNNENDNNQINNIEKQVNLPQTEQWTDDRSIWIWRVTQLNNAVFNNKTYYYLDMMMNPASPNDPVFSFCDDNNGETWRTTSDTTITMRAGFRFQRQATLAYADNTYFILTGQDTSYGDPDINMGYLELTGNGDNDAPSRGNDRRWITIVGEDYLSRQVNRYPYPKLIAETAGTDANIYITYYEAHTSQKNLNFISFRATGKTTGNLTQATADDQRSANVLVIPGTASASSQYFDMVKIGTTGIAVVYYDSSVNNLKLTYSVDAFSATTNLTNLAATWNTITIDDNYQVGEHVSMLYYNNKLYVAYLDSYDSNLKFLRLNWNNPPTTPPSIDSGPIFIDKYQQVGSWTNILIIDRDGAGTDYTPQPYITYYADWQNNSNKPIRISFPNFDATTGALLHGVTGNGADEEYSGNWESITVPAVSKPKGAIEQFHHTQLGVYANNSQNLPVVGWLADWIEYAKLQPNN